MRTITTILFCCIFVFGLNYAISLEPIGIINQHQIEARTEDDVLLITIHQEKSIDVVQQIHWILSIIEDHHNGTDIVFITPIGEFKIDRITLKKYYSIQPIDRAGAINLEVMRVK